MERSHPMLEKKLHELEMQFTDLFVPPANSIKVAKQESLSKEITARVEFLKNLLSIEKECHLHGNASSHLVKLEEQLEGLETVFRDWKEGSDHDLLKKHVLAGEFSLCSCTRSCFSGEDEDEEKEEVTEEEMEEELEEECSGVAESECFELEIEDPSVYSEVKRFDEGKIKVDEKKPQGYYRPCFRRLRRIVALVGVAVVVVIGVTVVISEVFGGFQEDVFYLVPT